MFTMHPTDFTDCCPSVGVFHDTGDRHSSMFTNYHIERSFLNGKVHYTSEDGTRAISYFNNKWHIQRVEDRYWFPLITLQCPTTGVNIILGSKVQCLFVLKLPPQRGEGEKREGVQILELSIQSLWPKDYVHPCSDASFRVGRERRTKTSNVACRKCPKDVARSLARKKQHFRDALSACSALLCCLVFFGLF